MMRIIVCLVFVGSFLTPSTFAQIYGKLFEDLIVESSPISSKQGRLELAAAALVRIQSNVTGDDDLDKLCYVGDCQYSQVTRILSHPEDSTLYWFVLNCVKHGVGCGENSEWMQWKDWNGVCSARCGEGRMTRWRHCHVSAWGAEKCDGVNGEMKSCRHDDKLLCLASPSEPDEWSNWSAWGSCDQTCGEYVLTTRTRVCQPSGYDLYCHGDAVERSRCIDIPDCPVNGYWSQWSSWSTCVATTCRKSYGLRTRTCSNPAPMPGGLRCRGPVVEISSCGAPRCNYLPPSNIIRFTPSTSLVYRPHPAWPYLSIVLKFRPVSSDGVLLRHSGKERRRKPTSSTKVKVKLSGSERNSGATSRHEYVEISLDDGEVLVSVLLNDSDPVVIHAGKANMLQWNIVRLLVVSDVINVRLNNGENMKASLQDSPVRPDELHVTHDKGEKRWWGNLWKNEGEHPEAPGETLTRKTRAILASITGSLRVGRYKNKLGFRGYVSMLLVNFVLYNFETRPRSQISTLRDPIVTENMEIIQYRDYNMYDVSQLPHFNGRLRLFAPLAMQWWDNSFKPAHFKEMKANEFVETDAARVKLIFKPETSDGVLMWNQGKRDLATQWKVVIENGTRVKFVSALHGGNVHVVSSTDTLRVRDWNVLEMLLVRNGEVHFRLNSEQITRGRVPPLNISSEPGSILILGGSRKFGQLDKTPRTVEESHVAPFHGYIYSFTQNDVEFIVHGKNVTNAWGMPLTEVLNKPMFTEFWYFKPLYQEDPSYAPGFVNSLLQFLRLQNPPLKTLSTDGEKLTLADIRARGNVREIACEVPVSPDILHVPHIMWFKDGVPIGESDHFIVREMSTSSSVRSSVFFLPTPEGSKQLSGVYSCMVEDRGDLWVLANHVVAVINNNIADPNSLLMTVLVYIRESTGATETQSMFIAAAIATGVAMVLVLICLFQRWNSKRKKTSGGKKKKKKAEEQQRDSDETIALLQEDNGDEDTSEEGREEMVDEEGGWGDGGLGEDTYDEDNDGEDYEKEESSLDERGDLGKDESWSDEKGDYEDHDQETRENQDSNEDESEYVDLRDENDDVSFQETTTETLSQPLSSKKAKPTARLKKRRLRLCDPVVRHQDKVFRISSHLTQYLNEIHALKLIRSFSKLFTLYQRNTSYLSDE